VTKAPSQSDSLPTNVRTIVSEALLEIDYWEEVKGAYEPGEEPDGPLPIDSDDAEEWCNLEAQ
jgi:hypothetical protein